MKRFIELAVERAGLEPVLAARRSGRVALAAELLASLGEVDLLALGAAADTVRAAEVGDLVRVHEGEAASGRVVWIPRRGQSELALLREVAVARLSRGAAVRVGVDWSALGLEFAQVALGFGASDLTGPITKKSGLPILGGEAKRVKGEGLVELADLRRKEIERLLTCAGRRVVFVTADAKSEVEATEVSGA